MACGILGWDAAVPGEVQRELHRQRQPLIALCLALELSREDADKLLSSAGYSLSRVDDFDLVIAFCIEKKIFNFFDINEALFHFGFEPF